MERWKGTHWFIEGDLSDCFGSLDHAVPIKILSEKIHDGRFLQLIRRMLKAGSLADWRWHATLSGPPQGGVASPIFSNTSLDRLDRYVEQRLLPDYNVGRRRQANPEYRALAGAIRRARRRGGRMETRRLSLQRRPLPSQGPHDPHYRRLRHIGYADDGLLGLAGPKREAEASKSKIAAFLPEGLKLELSQTKALITHATSEAARFRGSEITAQHGATKIARNRRSVNAEIALVVPKTGIRQRGALDMAKGKPAHRGLLRHDADFTVVAKYGAKYASHGDATT